MLTETYAKKYFRDENPLGRYINVENDSNFFIVTGIVKDCPPNSHMQFDMLGSITSNSSWNNDQWIGSLGFHTYLVLRNDADVKALQNKMQELVYKYIAPEIEHYTRMKMSDWEKAGNHTGFYLIALKDIHLRSTSTKELTAGGSITYIRIYALIALSILFIAVFNFVNMATVQSTSRAKEVGIRKVLGSTKAGLIYQFVLESIIVSVSATFLSVMLTLLIKPFFIELIGKELAIDIAFSFTGVLFLLVLAVATGILAGSYPAFILANFHPAHVLKGKFNPKIKTVMIRNVLVVMQFSVSLAIIIVTLVIYSQINFLMSKNLGYNRNLVLAIRRAEVLQGGLETFENELKRNPDISDVANSETIPGKEYVQRTYRPKDNHETFLFNFNHVSYNYKEILDLKLSSGRFFSRKYGSDSNSVVINEAAARALALRDPIGVQLTSPWHPGELLTIIGVIRDYNIESLHKKIEPVALELFPDKMDGYILVRFVGNHNIHKTREDINDLWSRHTNRKPFESFFLNEDYANLYQSEFTTEEIFIVFAVLSVLIACLGLIGLLAFTVSMRKKEIGIRKIMGAGTGKLIRLLSDNIVKLFIIATLVAIPSGYIASEYWLQRFAEHVRINPLLFVASTIIIGIFCLIAISLQIVKAVRSNPADTLRQE